MSPDLEGILQAHDRAVANQYSSACGREFSRFGTCVPWVVSVKLWCQGWSQTDQARRRRDGHIRAGRFSVCHGIESFRNLIREKKVVVFTCNQSVQSSVSQTTTTWISSFAQYAPWKNSSDYGSSVCHPSQTLLMSSLERDLWDFVVWCPWLWTWKPCGASAWRRECAVPPVCGSDARHKRQDSMVCPVVKKNEHIVCSEFMSFATCSLNAAAWEIRCNPTCWWNIIS